MKKIQFLSELKKRIYHLDIKKQQSILRKYDLIITNKMRFGMSEEDAVASVGTIDEIVNNIENNKKNRENAFHFIKQNIDQKSLNNRFQKTIFNLIVYFFVFLIVKRIAIDIIFYIFSFMELDINEYVLSATLNFLFFIGFFVFIKNQFSSKIKHDYNSLTCTEHDTHENKSFSLFHRKRDIGGFRERFSYDGSVRDFEREFLNDSYNSKRNDTDFSQSVISDAESYSQNKVQNIQELVNDTLSMIGKIFRFIFRIFAILGIISSFIMFAFLFFLNSKGISFISLFITVTGIHIFNVGVLLCTFTDRKSTVAKGIVVIILSIMLSIFSVPFFIQEMSEIEVESKDFTEFLYNYEFDMKSSYYESDLSLIDINNTGFYRMGFDFELYVDESLEDNTVNFVYPDYLFMTMNEYNEIEFDFINDFSLDRGSIDFILNFIDYEIEALSMNKFYVIDISYVVDEDLKMYVPIKVYANSKTINNISIYNDFDN